MIDRSIQFYPNNKPVFIMKITTPSMASSNRLLHAALLASLTALTACTGAPITPSTATSATSKAAALSENYRGVFLAPCSELASGIYFSDAMQLEPVDATHIAASYYKAFFSTPDCSGNKRLVRFALPAVTWEIIGQTLIGNKMVDQVIVTLSAGPMTAVISNADKVKETDDQFIISYGDKDGRIPFQKIARGGVDKELRLLENKQMFMGDEASPRSPDGFPSALSDLASFVQP